MNFIDKQQGSQTERLQDFLRFGLRELQNNNALKLLVRDKVSGEGLRELQNNKALKPSGDCTQYEKLFKRITKQQGSQTPFSVIPRPFGLRELQNNKALKRRALVRSRFTSLRELQNNKALKHLCL